VCPNATDRDEQRLDGEPRGALIVVNTIAGELRKNESIDQTDLRQNVHRFVPIY
jgi:hypothetical protein